MTGGRRILAGQGLRYLVTGSLAAVTDIGVFALLIGFGMGVPAAATLSFVAASVANYLLTAHFVFQAQRSTSGYLRFVGFALIGLAVNVTLTMAFATYTPLVPVAAKIAAIAISFVVNFTVFKLFVFRAEPASEERG